MMFNIKLRAFVAFCATLLHTAIYASDQEPFEQRKPQTIRPTEKYTSSTPITVSDDPITIDTFYYILPYLRMADVIQATYTCKNWENICNSNSVWIHLARRLPGYEWGASTISSESSKEVVKLLIGIHYIYTPDLEHFDSRYHNDLNIALAKSYSKLPSEVVDFNKFPSQRVHQIKLKNGESYSLVTPNIDGDDISVLHAANSTGSIIIGEYPTQFKFIIWTRLKDKSITTDVTTAMHGYKFFDADENGNVSVGTYGNANQSLIQVVVLRDYGIFAIKNLVPYHSLKDKQSLTVTSISSNGRILKGRGKYVDHNPLSSYGSWVQNLFIFNLNYG